MAARARVGGFAALARRCRCCAASGYDCGHGHVDAISPGLFRGVVKPCLPALALSLSCSAVAAAAPASPTAASSSIALIARHLSLAAKAALLVTALVVLANALVSKARPAHGAPSSAALASAASAREASALASFLARRDELAARLGAALRCRTVSYDADDAENATDYAEFDKLAALLEASFPLVHRHLKRTVVNAHSLVYEWEGADRGAEPYMAYAHLDVVPADAAAWSVDPFGGVVRDGFVWGRGAIDDKQAVLGHLEAVESLLAEGFAPRRSVYLCFGHDEEIGGGEGAKRIAEHLARRGVTFEFMLDEGLFVIDGVVPGHARPVAMVCVGEKGFLTARLTVECEPGHASAPPAEGAIGILARALSRLEKRPMPSHFDAARAMLSALGGGFRWPLQLLMANLWLFAPLLRLVFASKPKTATLVRTTTALTVLRAGNKANVLPACASAVVNHRIHPRDTVASTLAHDRRVIADDRVKIEVLQSTEPAPVSSTAHPAFETLRQTVFAIFPHASVAPGLFVAASDSKHFWGLARQIYRFNPVTLHASETSMFHGNDEKIGVENYAELCAFFRAFHVQSASRTP